MIWRYILTAVFTAVPFFLLGIRFGTGARRIDQFTFDQQAAIIAYLTKRLAEAEEHDDPDA